MGWWSAVENTSQPLEKRGLRTPVIYDDHGSMHPLQTSTSFVSVHTRVSKIFEKPEDGVDLRSLLRFLLPALLRDLPDSRGHSWGIEGTRLGWSPAFRDHDYDIVVREFGKGHLSGHELETKTIRTWAHHVFSNGYTSTMTIAREYTSDIVVGSLSWALSLRRSGADQRTVQS